MRPHVAALLSVFSSVVSASAAPNYPGLKTIWSDGFFGNAGELPNGNQWNIITKYVQLASLPWATY